MFNKQDKNDKCKRNKENYNKHITLLKRNILTYLRNQM